MAQPIPEGFHTITPDVVLDDAAGAIEFYKRALGAQEMSRMPMPGGQKLLHAELRIGDSILMLADEMPDMGVKSAKALGGSPIVLHLQVEDADATFKQAIGAGATETMPLMDAPWGDRYGQFEDPFGLRWSVGTHKEDLTPEQIAERFAQMAPTG